MTETQTDFFAGLTLAEEEELYLKTGKQFADYALAQDAVMASACYDAMRTVADRDLLAVAKGEDNLTEEDGSENPTTEFLEQQIKASYVEDMKPSELADSVRARLKSVKDAAGNYSEFYGYVAFLIQKRQGIAESWEEFNSTHTFAEVIGILFSPDSNFIDTSVGETETETDE